MSTSLPFRRSARALLVDEDSRVLLVLQQALSGPPMWITPGGGLLAGETAPTALRRELREELGLELLPDHPMESVWTQHLPLSEMHQHGFRGVINEIFLVRVPHFDPQPGVAAQAEGHPDAEGIHATRWWGTSELAAAADTVRFGPRDLPARVRTLLATPTDGGPRRPLLIVGP